MEKLVQRIVDNIEINVADIHIRCFFFCCCYLTPPLFDSAICGLVS